MNKFLKGIKSQSEIRHIPPGIRQRRCSKLLQPTQTSMHPVKKCRAKEEARLNVSDYVKKFYNSTWVNGRKGIRDGER